MITFNYTYDKCLDHKTPINWLLCLPFDIEEIELEVEYYISKYHPATFFSPAEGGDIEDWNVVVTDNRFNDKQKKIILGELRYDVIIDAIWAHHDTNKNKVDDWY